jgi:hypothetical protein
VTRPIDFRKCKKCKRVLTTDNFHRSQTGLQVSCKDCQKDQFNANLYEYMYGVPKEQVDAIRESQQNLCAICSVDLSTVKCCLDHNHKTMLIRGLLCSRCNSVLGYVQDDCSILERGIVYLNKFKDVRPTLLHLLNAIGKRQI